jgi:thymidine phosphorylase
MASPEQARELADSLIRTAAKGGLKSHALITDMNEVLGSTAGNAVEIRESVLYLRNEVREPRLDEVVLALCAEMVLLGGLASDRESARNQCEDALSSGKAAEIFGQMTSALGGPTDFVDNYDKYLVKAPVVRELHADGFVVSADTRAIGNAIIELGGGRRAVSEELDLSVGFTDFAPVGTDLGTQGRLAIIHAANVDDADRAAQNLLNAYELGDSAPPDRQAIYEILTG